jgi:antitoxin YefM
MARVTLERTADFTGRVDNVTTKRIINFSDARRNLRSVIDQVVKEANATVITRRNAPDVVVMSNDNYNSLLETVYLLSSPENVAHLAKSIEQARAGHSQPRKMIQ